MPFALWVCLVLSVGLILILTVQSIWQHRRRCVQLTHSASGWALEFGHTSDIVSGNLVQAGYRSAWLIILVIQSEDSALHRVTIWQDQVSPRQFSYLHQQLAFAAEPHLRRRPLFWLKDMVGMDNLPSTSDGRRNRKLRRQTRCSVENTLD